MTRRSRLIVASAIVVFAVLAILLTRQIPSRQVRGDPGPQAFPMATALLIAAGAAYAFAGDARSGAQPTEAWRYAVVVAAATVVYILVLSVLGFVVSTALFLFVVSGYLDRPRRVRPLVRLLVGAGVPVILWLVFGRLLNVVLPAGWMGF